MIVDYSLIAILLYLILGLCAGIVAGFVGVGGGIIMVPVLLELFRSRGIPADGIVQAAMGTSLAAAVFSVGSATIRHGRQHRVRWSLVPLLAPGSLFGGWLAARLAVLLPGAILQVTLAGMMIFGAMRMLRDTDFKEREPRRIRWWLGLLVGVGVGLVAGFSGLAGGIVLVPALALILAVPTGWLAGTSSATIIFSALAAAVGYLSATPPTPLESGFVGYVCLPLSACLAAGAVVGAQAGAWLNRRTESRVFRRIFAVLLLVVVARMIIQLWRSTVTS